MTQDPKEMTTAKLCVDGASSADKETFFADGEKSIPRGKANDKSPGGETWMALCAQAAVEQDPKRLLELVSEINRLLDARKKRLTNDADGKQK